MSEIIRPKIELSKMDQIQCEKCGCKLFEEVSMLKKVPSLPLQSWFFAQKIRQVRQFLTV